MFNNFEAFSPKGKKSFSYAAPADKADAAMSAPCGGEKLKILQKKSNKGSICIDLNKKFRYNYVTVFCKNFTNAHRQKPNTIR